ncbi:GspI family T2SS minor pseudopilin variant LspI [Legionella impletisoli]|uniref:Type II secretion system protein I n=2 Tax=Bacteria TaxID=2 RepID=A0A917JPG0_9GAMM|nr:GspI family T2SS minor pseudopilin variant LspI [Legionella impletisoli]GGI76727.1 type II secretion system protein GspI [Legionella impletisoli]
MNRSTKQNGFTLIEVLLALAVLAIALTALLKATSQDVNYTQRIKERTISHWVAMQGVSAIQLGLITIPAGQPITEVTSMLNQNWYWRAQLLPGPFKKTQIISIKVSTSQSGPFTDELIAYRYLS